MDRLKWTKSIFLLGVFLTGLVILTVNCGEETKKEPPKTKKIPAKKADIALAYDGWSGTYLPMYVLKIIACMR